MTDENAKKKYEHLKSLISGNLKTGNAVRDDLIVSDAERHLKQLKEARPNIVFETPKVETPKVEAPKKVVKDKETA